MVTRASQACKAEIKARGNGVRTYNDTRATCLVNDASHFLDTLSIQGKEGDTSFEEHPHVIPRLHNHEVNIVDERSLQATKYIDKVEGRTLISWSRTEVRYHRQYICWQVPRKTTLY